MSTWKGKYQSKDNTKKYENKEEALTEKMKKSPDERHTEA